jgi:dihydroxy-acid dehydratase
MGELERAGLMETSVNRIDGRTLKEAVDSYDIMRKTATDDARKRFLSSPGDGSRNLVMASQENYYTDLDTDREKGCIRNIEHAYNKDGGLAVLYGNIAKKGCIVKTAGVDPFIFNFSGTAKVFDSQEEAVNGILSDTVQKGDVVVIRYEGPKGGPGMQEMLYPTSYLKSMQLDKYCALITDGRFSGGTTGLSIGHISPEAAAGGAIALIRNNDRIDIDIANRSVHLAISDEELEQRRKEEEAKGDNAFRPEKRNRQISKALKAYACLVSSADRGAVRLID